MSTPERLFADALRDAHTALLRDLQELEKAVSSTASEGPAELGTRLGKVRTHLADHFRFEEEGGYMAPVLKEEPRLSAQIQELLAEHSQMAQALETIIEEVGRGPTVQDVSRQKIHAWVGKVRHHETRENDLVQEAYYSSGATGD
jgi:hemerythrin-like domain-containing protein